MASEVRRGYATSGAFVRTGRNPATPPLSCRPAEPLERCSTRREATRVVSPAQGKIAGDLRQELGVAPRE